MAIDNKTKDEKLNYNICREAAKIPALSDEQHKNNRRPKKKYADAFKPLEPEENREPESIEGLFPKQMRILILN